LTAVAAAEPTAAAAMIHGLAAGWPADGQLELDEAAEAALVKILQTAPSQARGQLVSLASKLGSEKLDQIAQELSKELLMVVRGEGHADEQRVAAARQLTAFRPDDGKLVDQLLAVVSPRVSTELNLGILRAIRDSQAKSTGDAVAAVLTGMTPAVRTAALDLLLSRAEWTGALLDAAERGEIQLTELALDRRQNLAAHPDQQIAARAKALIARGGGLPDADRQKVIDELSKLVLDTGDAARGKLVYKQQCAKCHKHQGEGGEVGPDLTGSAAHPKSELLIHILDPSRSVEGNFRQYTVVTEDGRVISGLLGSESKNAVELIDAEGKRHPILREDIDELIVSSKSLMPEGFEKTIGAEGIADLLEYLTQRGKFLPLDLTKAATIVSTQGMFYGEDAEAERLVFPDWSPKTFAGVPFHLVDPQGASRPNVILLHGPHGKFPPQMPKSVELPVNSEATAIHLLSGVSGWGHPLGTKGTVSLVVRLHYESGASEDHELKNGLHFADYIRRVDVPESQFAFELRQQQVRYLAIKPSKAEKIVKLELIKGSDASAPIVMAITVETPAEHP
ncbi:MAG: c-type cytochrome, partial [Pirellulales bacterium]